MATTYTSIIPINALLNSGSIMGAIQREVGIIKNMYVYQDPYTASYLIKWEIEDSDLNWVREDF